MKAVQVKMGDILRRLRNFPWVEGTKSGSAGWLAGRGRSPPSGL